MRNVLVAAACLVAGFLAFTAFGKDDASDNDKNDGESGNHDRGHENHDDGGQGGDDGGHGGNSD